MASRLLLVGALLLSLSLKSQAQLHVTPKGWPRPTPRLSEKEKTKWRSILTELEIDKISLLERPRTAANRAKLDIINKQIQTARKMLGRNDIQLLSR